MNKEGLINAIVEIELRMFLAVPAAGNPSCRDAPDSFRIHRSAQFSAWSEATLESYLDDLQNAEKDGRNLLTYKYARMDELIPSENKSEYIELIAAQQMTWQRLAAAEYPKLMQNARGITDSDASVLDVSFERYLKAELESYSVRTLELLFKDVENCRSHKTNMSEKIYESLVKSFGYDSLDIFR